MKIFLNYILYIIYLLLIVGLGIEIFLRIYSPVEMRISSGKIILPKNQKYFLENTNFTKLKKNGIHTKNSLGFRGEEWNPKSDRIKMLFVGGSTTECFYTDDSNLWTEQFAKHLGNRYLVNNAGLNGHSTVGHIKLLQEYIGEIQPDYVFFLTGINDLALTETGQNAFDDRIEAKGLEKLVLFIESKSRLVNLLHSFYRSYQAKKAGLADTFEWKLSEKEDNFQFTEKQKSDIFKKHALAQKDYKNRLLKLIDITKSSGATPVFITQPLLFFDGIDPETGIDLGNFKIYGLTGKEYWEKLEIYNRTMRETAQEFGVKLIDLSQLLEHNSLYFYDDMHFSDAGSEKIGEILMETRENME